VESGTVSFSSFHLTWGNTVSTRIDVDVKPFENPSLVKLRQWADGEPRNLEEIGGIPESLQGQGNSVLTRLAQLHYELLQKSGRWNSAAVSWSAEASELLARIELMTSPEEL